MYHFAITNNNSNKYNYNCNCTIKGHLGPLCWALNFKLFAFILMGENETSHALHALQGVSTFLLPPPNQRK